MTAQILDGKATSAAIKDELTERVAALRPAAAASVGDYDDLDATTTAVGDTWVTDGCRTAWAGGGLGGRDLGRVVVRRSPPPGGTYFLAGFLPC